VDPILKRIPKGARILASLVLENVLMRIVDSPEDLVAWNRLFAFSHCLVKPQRGRGVRRNLTSSVLARLKFFNEGGVFGPSVSVGLGRLGGAVRERGGGFDSEVARRASIKLGDGDIRGAIRLLCSQEGGVSPSAESAAQMRDKHPPPSGVSFTPP